MSFNGLESKEKEWIDTTSHRLAPVHSHTSEGSVQRQTGKRKREQTKDAPSSAYTKQQSEGEHVATASPSSAAFVPTRLLRGDVMAHVLQVCPNTV